MYTPANAEMCFTPPECWHFANHSYGTGSAILSLLEPFQDENSHCEKLALTPLPRISTLASDLLHWCPRASQISISCMRREGTNAIWKMGISDFLAPLVGTSLMPFFSRRALICGPIVH